MSTKCDRGPWEYYTSILLYIFHFYSTEERRRFIFKHKYFHDIVGAIL